MVWLCPFDKAEWIRFPQTTTRLRRQGMGSKRYQVRKLARQIQEQQKWSWLGGPATNEWQRAPDTPGSLSRTAHHPHPATIVRLRCRERHREQGTLLV